MSRLIIPTFNRSAKLKRVLDWYESEKLTHVIVILDASDDPLHQQSNIRAAQQYGGTATRIDTMGQNNILERLLTYLVSIDDDSVAIGNDEDAFLPEFLDAAFEHLRTHADYSLVTGRYITSASALWGVRRITSWTDTFLGMDVGDDRPAVRALNFQRMNAGGVPPLFWSVRRRTAFVESCVLARRLKFASAHELLDQITTCALGKVAISSAPMLLRDESRVKYKKFENRDEGRLYIGSQDLDELERVAAERWPQDIALAVQMITSWYRPDSSGESYQSRHFSRSYSRFQPIAPRESTRLLRVLCKMIGRSCAAGILMSQVLAYVYFWRYMAGAGRGRRFWRMTRSIAVNKAAGPQR